MPSVTVMELHLPLLWHQGTESMLAQLIRKVPTIHMWTRYEKQRQYAQPKVRILAVCTGILDIQISQNVLTK